MTRKQNPYRNQLPVFKRIYNGNQYEREGRNGRIYIGTFGWRWIPHLCGHPVGDPDGYKTKTEADQVAKRIIETGQDTFSF